MKKFYNWPGVIGIKTQISIFLRPSINANRGCFIANMLFSPQLRVRIAAGIGIGVAFGSSLEYNTNIRSL
jgi:hypothetical protein